MEIAVLIATRNRPTQLSLLLDSLSNQIKMPSQVIVVSSGMKIEALISGFRSQLAISHFHSDKAGQIRQKLIGIKGIKPGIQWVLFLDDDFILSKEVLRKIEKRIIELETTVEIPVVGLGLKIPSTSHLSDSRMKRSLAKIFLLNSKKSGSVLRSGHPVSYLQQKELTKTEWLNGISVWRIDICEKYDFDFLDAKYSAMEDVIFSYEQNSHGGLFFDPSIEVNAQGNQVTDLSLQNIFVAASFWRLKFIFKYLEFSKMAFLWSQLGRSIFFIMQNSYDLEKTLVAVRVSIKVYLEIIYQLVYKREPNWSLNRNCIN